MKQNNSKNIIGKKFIAGIIFGLGLVSILLGGFLIQAAYSTYVESDAEIDPLTFNPETGNVQFDFDLDCDSYEATIGQEFGSVCPDGSQFITGYQEVLLTYYSSSTNYAYDECPGKVEFENSYYYIWADPATVVYFSQTRSGCNYNEQLGGDSFVKGDWDFYYSTPHSICCSVE